MVRQLEDGSVPSIRDGKAQWGQMPLDGTMRLLGPYRITHETLDLPGKCSYWQFLTSTGMPSEAEGETYKVRLARILTDWYGDNENPRILNSPSGNFDQSYIGKPISGFGLSDGNNFPQGTPSYIVSVLSSTSVLINEDLGLSTDPEFPEVGMVGIGNISTAIPAEATMEEIQEYLEDIMGVGNVEVFNPESVYEDGISNYCNIFLVGSLAYQPYGLILEEATSVEAWEQSRGDSVPRLGKILFTPEVGDAILQVYALTTVAWEKVGGGEVDLWYGDVGRVDLNAIFGLQYLIPGLADGSQFIPVQEQWAKYISSYSKLFVRAGFGSWSQDIDRTTWDAAFSIILKSIPFAITIGGTGGLSLDVTNGVTDVYVLMARPSTEY